MPASKRHPQPHTIIHKLRSLHRIRRHPILHPSHQRRQHVIRSFEWHARCSSATALAEHPGARAGVAVEHAGDAEEAQESVEVVGGGLHAVGKVTVESLGVEASDLVVLSTVVSDDFAAGITICGEVGRPCSNIGGVEGFGDGGVMDGEGGSVPCWITVDDVSEPVLVEVWHEQRNGLGLG